MVDPETTRPTLAAIRARASECGIDIAAGREASILAGAHYLHDAVQRLQRIATGDEPPPEPSRR